MFSFARLRTQQLAGICRRVGTALEAGIDARTAWEREAERASGRAAAALRHVRDEIQRGSSTADALAGTGVAFPELVHDMVAVGEQTGYLDRVLLRVAEHCDHLLNLRRIFLSGIAWPAIQLGLAIVVIGLLILVMGLIPQDPRQPVDLLGLGLRGPGGMAVFLLWVFALGAGMALLVWQWRNGKWGAAMIWTALYRVPGLGPSLQTMALGRMAWSLSLTTDTPMDTAAALRLALRSSQSPIYTATQDEVSAAITRGQTMHSALKQTGAFPDEFLDAIAVGEETGRLSESLRHASVQYEERAKSAARTLTVVGSLLVWALVSGVIIFFILRLAMFYAGMIEDLASPSFR